MKFIVCLTSLGLVLILSLPILSLVARIAEIQSIQQAQQMGFEVASLDVVDKTVIAAWIRKDCSFLQTTYVELLGRSGSETFKISFCINEWTGNSTYRIRPQN